VVLPFERAGITRGKVKHTSAKGKKGGGNRLLRFSLSGITGREKEKSRKESWKNINYIQDG